MVSKMSKRYAVVTTIQTFKHRYVVSEDRLQSLNEDSPAELGWADDCVTCDQIDEFSQKYIDESIIESKWMKEDDVLSMFDEDPELEYLKDWDKEQRLTYINHGLILDKDD